MSNDQLICGSHVLSLAGEPLIMGILNVTPDSFSDGGEFFPVAAAVEHALTMVAEGAAIIDIGGESTRPGAPAVSPEEQIRRVEPVIRQLTRQIKVPISIDTTNSRVAQAALDAGATVVNDISALRFDPALASLVSRCNVPVILMHMLGTPRTMQQCPKYEDVVREVKTFLAERIEFAVSAGINPSQIVIDPGIGFGKTVQHNLRLIKHVREFIDLAPVLVGPSRKTFIGKVLHLESPSERLFGTAAAVAWCVAAGVQIIRVHDVKAIKHIAQMTAALRNVGE